jgi:hypothetical protein
MRLIITLLALAVITGSNCALGAEAVATDGPKPNNPFSEPFDLMGARFQIGGEDRASPFTEAHNIEQSRYESAYFAQYHGFAPGMTGPMPPLTVPKLADANEHPLWFDGTQGEYNLSRLVTGLFGRDQFGDLEKLFDDWQNPKERLADGRWKLAIFERALRSEFEQISDWDRLLEHIREWQGTFPKSRAAALTEAMYWRAYAWNARGTGYSNSVTQDGWQLFQQRLEKSLALLLESKTYTSTSPLWARMFLATAGDLGWPKQKLLEAFRDLVKTQSNFDPLYLAVVSSLVPKWGGNWQLVDIYVRDAVSMTQEFDGHAMYARLYWQAYLREGSQTDLFRNTRAQWADMKKGFEDLMRSYPHSAFNFNTFAAAACMAGDKEEFQSLRFRIGKFVIPDAWPSNYSPDLCEHKFAANPL